MTERLVGVTDLTYRYPRAEEPALRGVTFDLAAGQVVGLLGPSGVGKTTTVRIVTGLLAGWSGQVEVAGRAIGAWGRGLYEQIGVGFELPASWTRLTAAENLELVAALHDRPCRDAVELLDLVGLVDAADQRVGEFSKGMHVRLNLARALLHQPKLLVLDEPTAGLDPVTARRIRAVIRAETERGVGVLVTTHDLTTVAELCDEVGFLAAGRLSDLEAPTSLQRRLGHRQVRVEYLDESGLAEAVFSLDGLGKNEVFLDLLRTKRVEAMHTAEADLTDVYALVTGQAAS